MLVCVPFARLNLDDNMSFQWLSAVAQLAFSFVFAAQFIFYILPGSPNYCEGNGPGRTPFVGIDITQVGEQRHREVAKCLYCFVPATWLVRHALWHSGATTSLAARTGCLMIAHNFDSYCVHLRKWLCLQLHTLELKPLTRSARPCAPAMLQSEPFRTPLVYVRASALVVPGRWSGCACLPTRTSAPSRRG